MFGLLLERDTRADLSPDKVTVGCSWGKLQTSLLSSSRLATFASVTFSLFDSGPHLQRNNWDNALCTVSLEYTANTNILQCQRTKSEHKKVKVRKGEGKKGDGRETLQRGVTGLRLAGQPLMSKLQSLLQSLYLIDKTRRWWKLRNVASLLSAGWGTCRVLLIVVSIAVFKIC